MTHLQPLCGLLLIGLVAYALSTDRRAIRLRTVAWGFALQFLFAVIVLKTTIGSVALDWASQRTQRVLSFAYEGTSFVFGIIGNQTAWTQAMVKVFGPDGVRFGAILAFQLLPAIIFTAALFAILYHLGIMQLVVRAFAFVMQRVMGASGAESLDVAASIFMGQTEAPLTIRPYLSGLTQSELMTVMTAGMAHISGALLGVYASFGMEIKHLLTAVIMTAPGTLMLAKVLVPETATPETLGTVTMAPSHDVNVIEAAGRGTSEGLHLWLNVCAMLISFIALVALANAILSHVGGWVGHPEFTLQWVLGRVLAPVAWCLGVTWHDAPKIGDLLGQRTVLNEFIAFSQLGPMKAQLDPRSFVVATFALCGFANFGSIGIQIGGIGALVPERRSDLARLGMRAMLAGTLANFASACIAALLM